MLTLRLFLFLFFDYRFDYRKNPKRVKERRKKRILPKGFFERFRRRYGKIRKNVDNTKKNPQRREARQGFYGAPNRIRTCGLLIRSQTLYPAELWVQSSFFLFRSLGTKMIIPRIAENVNTFLKIIFHFLALRPKRRISAKTRATFGG